MWSKGKGESEIDSENISTKIIKYFLVVNSLSKYLQKSVYIPTDELEKTIVDHIDVTSSKWWAICGSWLDEIRQAAQKSQMKMRKIRPTYDPFECVTRP